MRSAATQLENFKLKFIVSILRLEHKFKFKFFFSNLSRFNGFYRLFFTLSSNLSTFSTSKLFFSQKKRPTRRLSFARYTKTSRFSPLVGRLNGDFIAILFNFYLSRMLLKSHRSFDSSVIRWWSLGWFIYIYIQLIYTTRWPYNWTHTYEYLYT